MAASSSAGADDVQRPFYKEDTWRDQLYEFVAVYHGGFNCVKTPEGRVRFYEELKHAWQQGRSRNGSGAHWSGH